MLETLGIKPHMSAADRVYSSLLDDILRMKLLPGQVISEKLLKERFNISRQPVREALIKLSMDGLVTVVPQVRTHVAYLNAKLINETVFARCAVEAEAIKLVSRTATEEDIARLHLIIADQERACAAGDADGLDLTDRQFHRELLAIADVPGMWPMVEQLRRSTLRSRAIVIEQMNGMDQAILDHKRILDAIERRSAEEAEQAIRRHINVHLDYLRKIEKIHPELFSPGS